MILRPGFLESACFGHVPRRVAAGKIKCIKTKTGLPGRKPDARDEYADMRNGSLTEALGVLHRADYAILRLLCGVAPGARAKAGLTPEGLPAIQDCGTPYTNWRTPPDAATQRAKPNILP